jgi:hypothetical protein
VLNNLIFTALSLIPLNRMYISVACKKFCSFLSFHPWNTTSGPAELDMRGVCVGSLAMVFVCSEMSFCDGVIACVALGFTNAGTSGESSRVGLSGFIMGNWRLCVSSLLSFPMILLLETGSIIEEGSSAPNSDSSLSANCCMTSCSNSS